MCLLRLLSLRLSLGLSLVCVLGGAALGAPPATVAGRVLDEGGRPLPGATVTLAGPSGSSSAVQTDASGSFEIRGDGSGTYRLTAEVAGRAVSTQEIALRSDTVARVEIVLPAAAFRQEIRVLGERIAPTAERVDLIPGSIEVLDRETLERSHVAEAGDALRMVAGVHVRDEEGFGMRPNIGIRGLNPTRSSKVLLLEDGIPLTFAPYGDNASYFHPAIESFDTIEVLKGSGQIAYGPATIGGVVNYLTPDPPRSASAELTLLGGNRAFGSGHARVGTTFGSTGVLFSYTHREGDGSRENIHLGLDDLHFKLTTVPAADQSLTFRASYMTEDSQATYSGLRQAEYEADSRGNPFSNDRFEAERVGASASHTVRFSPDVALTTHVYGSRFDRDWWRQSSNSRQRPNDSGDPRCGGMANLHTTCGNEGRLRHYTLWGVEPRLRVGHRVLGADGEADLGLRAHFETQERRQENGDTPDARDGRLVEDNRRETEAFSAFAQERLRLGAWTVTPGVRVEHVRYERTNRLGNAGLGVSGSTELTQLVPGLGVSRNFGPTVTAFAGIHRGFAPPRTEDIIDNATGGVVDLDAELSWNSEFGVRWRVRPGLALEATAFRMDYENQVVQASVAGGAGATLTNGGETLHQGLEAALRANSWRIGTSSHGIFLRGAYTWLPVAEFRGERFSLSGLPVSGNRLPYAPEHTFTAGIGYEHTAGLTLIVEAVSVGSQFADDLNTRAPSADGQRGLISEYTIWNASVEYEVPSLRSAFFVHARNLEDETYIVDRTRGILPGNPRLVRAGFRVKL
ncbi:MAG: TonB-dependent receptor domain-containing protein [Thermoanaerobaculia bacterium]